ncbi:hypothetical protein [Legionella quateirensis]|uniref:Uncharacterized protein n=1 Tax=Legionella quateirensis TaxID=45072 RepID=Q49JC4_9GAMM|nr:hypothetical protein [Legionella quateirensis]AAX56152.1 unknown [Legionella quateirensis]KTD55414.1 hypothetical protein Lqua_0131 [Legionella quateirensis]STY16588.1 Uncharacterised protein [Legionella quateirensis]
MSNASDGNLKYGDNRYGFHISTSSEKAGVPSEFVHQEVLARVKGLHQKTDRALSLRPDDPDYQFTVKLLENCATGVQNALDNKIVNQSESADYDQDENLSTSYTSPGL